VKRIKLTKNQWALVDDEDYDYFNQFYWQAIWDRKTKSYRACRTEYPTRRTILMHREIMNTPKELKCDHKDHDTLNNQKNNLRNVTNAQNSMNKKFANSTNSLGILGVQRHNKKFRAYIMIKGKQIIGKSKTTLDEAKQDRRNMEEKYFGEFSYIGV